MHICIVCIAIAGFRLLLSDERHDMLGRLRGKAEDLANHAQTDETGISHQYSSFALIRYTG